MIKGRGVNKKGQTEMSLGTLLAIVLGVVVVVVLILFFTGSFDRLTQTRDVLPGQLEAITQSCKLSVEASLISDYCYNFKKVSDDEYINCQDQRVLDSLAQQEVNFAAITCNSDLILESKLDTCGEVIASRKAEVTVGEENCQQLEIDNNKDLQRTGP